MSSRRRPGPTPTVDTGLRRYDTGVRGRRKRWIRWRSILICSDLEAADVDHPTIAGHLEWTGHLRRQIRCSGGAVSRDEALVGRELVGCRGLRGAGWAVELDFLDLL